MALEVPELPDKCPNCGLPVDEWEENEGRGVIAGGLTYCSEKCALEDQARG